MICLTCDIHHSSLGTGNQKACSISEVETTLLFMKLLEEASVKATFFVTGKTFVEEWETAKKFCGHPLISIQGHNYNCYQPELPHRIWKKLTGNYHGPASWEKRDIYKTIHVIQEKTGERIRCWRNHMYMHGPNTSQILKETGIELCSDGVKASASQPERDENGLWHFPINVIPDHEHIYHAERTPEWVEWWVKRYNWSDDFGPHSYPIEEWTDIAIDCVRKNAERGAISNLMIHPITMYLSDRFRSFEKILGVLNDYSSVHMVDLIPDSHVRYTKRN